MASRLRRHLDRRAGDMVELTRTLARMETPSRDPASQRPILDLLAHELRGCGLRTRRVPGRRTGGHLFALPEDRTRGRPFQLVLGHCDTVWPAGTLEEMPVKLEGDLLRGPGVFDMKAGLAQAIFALRALQELEMSVPADPVVLVTSDEEVGSPESARWIRRLARRACRAYVVEPALGPEGALKTARKGTARFEVRVTGREAHVGLAPGEGASAVQELAHVIHRLHGLSDPDRGILVNVGEVEGGVRPNVVAPRARAVVDVRVPDEETGQRVTAAIQGLQPVTPGTSLEVHGGMDRPPMERTPRNRRLWEAARAAGRELGLELEEATSGGASDGNFTSRFTATLDGLGAVGDGAHARHEYARVDEMPGRSALLALLLLLPVEAASP